MILRTRHSSLITHHSPRRGYVLIAVLVVIVVLALAAYRFTDAMTAEHRVGVRNADLAQARAAAASGIHYAAAILSDRDTLYSALNGDPFSDNAGIFADQSVRLAEEGREAKFSVIAVVPLGNGVYDQRYAVTDEGGKLNINSMIALDKSGKALFNALTKLPDMTPEIADAIVDWVDADDKPGSAGGTTGGAETPHYQGLPSPYKAKDGPLNSLDELLLVRGVTPYLLFGTDRNRNGVADDDGQALGRGWADYLTVHGREVNVDSTGTLRVYINGDEPKAIYDALRSAVGDEMAAYIIAAKLFGTTRLDDSGNPIQGKGKGGSGGGGPTQVGSVDQLIAAVEARLASVSTSGRAISSLIDLRNTRVTLPRPPGAQQNTPTTVVNSPLNDPARLDELLPPLMDKVTTKKDVELIPRINVLTAPREVLLGIPGLTEGDVDLITGTREGVSPTAPAAATAAWLVTEANLPAAKFRAAEKYVTGSSLVYRVQSVGFVAGGPVARVEAVIDTNLGHPRILYYRDLTDLDSPRAYQPAKK